MSDDDLHEFDLSAWDAPPPPANLADAVIARMTATDEAIAVAIGQRTSRRKRVAGIGIGIAAVAALAIGAWLVVRPGSPLEHVEPNHGEVLASGARHVTIGATAANLDASSSLAWQRDGATLRVVQRGNVSWLVGGQDQLVIDAAPASIEASNANLRVEIAMNMTDVKVIGASAATAAAVSLLTVVVYEGHVKATSGGQTTVVVPGTTVEVKPGEPPHDRLAVGANNPAPAWPLLLPSDPTADLALPDGESATVYDPRGETVVQFVHHNCGKPIVNIAGIGMVDGPVTLKAGHYTYTMTCAPITDSPNGTLDIVHDTGTMGGLPVATIDAPVDGAAWPDPIHVAGNMVTGAKVAIGGKVVLVDNGHGFAGDLPAGDERKVIALRVEYEHHASYFIRRAGTGDHTVAAHKDFDFTGTPALDRAAIQKVVSAARAKLNACNANGAVSAKLDMRLTIAASGDVTKVDWERDVDAPATAEEIKLAKCATVVLSKLQFPASSGGTVVSYPIVFAAGPKQTPSVPAKCDADTLREQGTNAEAMGAHEQALKKFEQANACKSDNHTVQLAFMAACNAKDVAKARQFWGQMAPQVRERVVVLCLRNGIAREKLDVE